MNDKFKAVGLPENTEIDIPDKGNVKAKNASALTALLSSDSVDDILQTLFSSVGANKSADLNKLLSILETTGAVSFSFDPATGQLAANIPADGKISTDDVSMLLDINNVWAVPCKKDPNLKQNFENTFGKDNIPLNKFDNTMPTYTVSSTDNDDGYLGYLNNFKAVDYQDKYILLYGEPDKDSVTAKYSFGAFVAMIEEPDGQFAMVLPEYGNTYDVSTKMIYTAEEPDDLFDDNGNFMGVDIDKIEAGLNMVLYYPKDVLVSPLKFGTFTYQEAGIPEDVKAVDRVKIGVLTDNGSTEASLFKKDFDLDPNKTVFDFYLKFSRNMTAEEANAINKMFAEDMTNSAIFTDSELKADGDDLYITFDTDSFAGLLDKWLRE